MSIHIGCGDCLFSPCKYCLIISIIHSTKSQVLLLFCAGATNRAVAYLQVVHERDITVPRAVHTKLHFQRDLFHM